MPRQPLGKEERIRHTLRRRVQQKGDDLDWDTLLDADAMQMEYDMAGGSRGLAEVLDISIEATKKVLRVHGIKLRRQGGAYTKTAAQLGLTTTADLHEIGRSYGFTDMQLALLRAHARVEIRACPAICPLALNCWDGQSPKGRRKRSNCGLADHLVTVGLAKGNGNGGQ